MQFPDLIQEGNGASCARSTSSSTSAATSSRRTRLVENSQAISGAIADQARTIPCARPTCRDDEQAPRVSAFLCGARHVSRRPRRAASGMELSPDKVAAFSASAASRYSLETPVGRTTTATWRSHRGRERAAAGRGGDRGQPARSDAPRAVVDHAARGAGAPPALRHRRAVPTTRSREVGRAST